MAIVGSSSNPGGGNFNFSGANTLNQCGSAVVMPANGRITDLGVYVSGDGASTSMILCLWDSTGALLAQTASFTCASGSHSVLGQAWQVQNLVTPYQASSGVTYYIGFWRDATKSSIFTVNSSGTFTSNTNLTGSPGALTLSNPFGTNHSMGVYGDYTPATIHVRRSGVWVVATGIKVRRSGAWVDATGVKVRRSGVWVDAT
jgi:hypothetical protein